jgi:hypothetical protein
MADRRNQIRICLDIALIIIGILTMLFAWAVLGIGIEALLIQQMHQLRLENTADWRAAFTQFCHGFDSYRCFLFFTGFAVFVIGICSLVLDATKRSLKPPAN